MARLQQKMQAAGTTGSAETPGLPCAMVFTLIRSLPGAPGLLATIIRATRKRRHKLDTSVGVSGPYDFTSARCHSSARKKARCGNLAAIASHTHVS
jgi:hypothetical protein